jgi:osmotically-inducible protein OsmY
MTQSKPDYLSEQIRQQLIHDSRVNEQDLVVDVRERTVTLEGNVSTQHLRETITRVATELLPDYEIVNQTRVVSSSEPVGEEPVG